MLRLIDFRVIRNHWPEQAARGGAWAPVVRVDGYSPDTAKAAIEETAEDGEENQDWAIK